MVCLGGVRSLDCLSNLKGLIMDSLHWLLLALVLAFALRSFWLSFTVEQLESEATASNAMLHRVLEKRELTFTAFRMANVQRCLKWHPDGIESWSPSDWLTAISGELGELASLVKMRNRERDGLPGNKFSPTDKQIADEVADVFTYLDLFAAAHDMDLGAAVTAKFNEVSERVGFPDRICPGAAP